MRFWVLGYIVQSRTDNGAMGSNAKLLRRFSKLGNELEDKQKRADGINSQGPLRVVDYFEVWCLYTGIMNNNV